VSRGYQQTSINLISEADSLDGAFNVIRSVSDLEIVNANEYTVENNQVEV